MATRSPGTKRGFALLLLAGVAAGALSSLVGETRPGQALERRIYDGWFAIRGVLPAPEEVVVVAIDEDSEEALGPFPWSRERHAHLLRNLHRAGARAVAFDFTVAEPRDDEDRSFRHAMDSTGIGLLGARYDPIVGRQRGGGRLEVPPGLLAGVPLGIVEMPADPSDGIVREYPVLHRYAEGGGDRTVPQLGIAALLVHLGLPPDSVRATRRGWSVGPFEIPRGPRGGMLIDYVGPWGSVTHRSYVDILDDAETDVGWDLDEFEHLLREGLLLDRIVFVGTTIPEHQDLHPTPFREAGPVPGVEIHAQAVAAILAGRHLRRAPWGAEYGWALLLALLTVVAARRLGAGWGAAAAAGLAGGAVFLSWALFRWQGIWLWTGAPVLSAGLGYTGAVAVLYLAEAREKARIRGLFQQYVAPSVVEELIRDPGLAALGGEERVLTVLFSDLESFSRISEKLTPTELVELLNEYLTVMTDVVVRHGGIIDKYQGDALMAEFGAPLPMEDHAARACRAALEMQRELARLREGWARKGRPLLRARIGINTGPVLLGNLGSRRVMDYTVMGDNVNLASRLEGVNKVYGTSIAVSEFTWEAAGDGFVGRELDRIRVEGREAPVGMYEVLATREEGVPPAVAMLVQGFAQALALYRERRFDEALEAFSALAAAHPEDGPSRAYVLRCRAFADDPPPQDWSGVHAMTSK